MTTEEALAVKKRAGATTRDQMPMAIGVGNRVRTGSFETYYESFGEGQPVICIPGDQCPLDTMRAMHVLSNDFRVILYDKRGHGRTPDTDDDWTYRDQAEDLKRLMEALVLDRAHLIGHSGGADIALEFVLAYPESVHSIISIGANYDNSWMDAEMRAAVESATPQTFMPELEEVNRSLSPDGRERYEEVVRKLRRLWLEYPKITIEQLQKVDAPVLVTVGDFDMIALPHTIRLYDALPNAELFIMPDSGHEQFFEKPDFVLPILRDFLRRHSS